MGLGVGDRLPEAVLLELRDGEPVEVPSAEAFAGRVAVFAMPGAFTKTCDGVHMPSVIRSAETLKLQGVERVAVLAVNDPFVLDAWAKASGAKAAGIAMLSDASGAFTRAAGMGFDAPSRGYYGRSVRYAMLVEDCVVRALGVEESRTECTLSGGEALLEAMRALPNRGSRSEA